MKGQDILKGKDFSMVAETHTDEKKRLILKKIKHPSAMYRIYENSQGQIILDPVVTIPASEAWLYKNAEAISSVRRGLREAAEGRLVTRRSYSSHAGDSLE